MLESLGYANGQASGLRALAVGKSIPVLTVRGTGGGAGASLVVAGLAHGLGRYYRTLVLDYRSGEGSLASIMGLRVRFDGRSVVNGEVPWSHVRVPVVPHVDYIGLGRGTIERMTIHHWRALAVLMRQYDLVLVDGDGQMLRSALGNALPLMLLVADGARSMGGMAADMFAAPREGSLGLVINRVGSVTDCRQIRERVRHWVGGRVEIVDFGGLPLARLGDSDRQWRMVGREDFSLPSLPDTLIRLPEAVQAWLANQLMDGSMNSHRVSGQGMGMRA